MPTRTPLAGGFFLTLCILGGFVAGLAIGNPMQGVLVGTALGASRSRSACGCSTGAAARARSICRPAQITRPMQ